MILVSSYQSPTIMKETMIVFNTAVSCSIIILITRRFSKLLVSFVNTQSIVLLVLAALYSPWMTVSSDRGLTSRQSSAGYLVRLLHLLDSSRVNSLFIFRISNYFHRIHTNSHTPSGIRCLFTPISVKLRTPWKDRRPTSTARVKELPEKSLPITKGRVTNQTDFGRLHQTPGNGPRTTRNLLRRLRYRTSRLLATESFLDRQQVGRNRPRLLGHINRSSSNFL